MSESRLRTKKLIEQIKRKMRSSLFLDKDGQEMLKDFESSLEQILVTSSSFEEIVDSNLNKRRRHLQLIVIASLLLYAIPVHLLQSIGYYSEDMRWPLFDTVFPDLFGHIPLGGPILNHCYTAFVVS